jgi:hypothetical protein
MTPIIIIIVAVVVPLVITFVVLKNVRAAFGMSPEKQAQAQNLVATGQKARAMILKVQPTGMIQEQVAVFREFGIPHPLDQQ